MTTTTDHQRLTDEQLDEIEENAGHFAARTDADLHKLVGEDVPALLANLKQARRGAQELGKTVVFLTRLIKDAFVRGADDPIDALHMLGNFLAEIFEDEGGLSTDEHNRVYRALEARRADEERAKAERDASERAAVAAAVKRASYTTT